MRLRFARAFNRWFGRHVVAAASSPNDDSDRVGLINRLFFLSDRAGHYRRRFKAWNRTAYKLTKAGLVVALTAALLLPTSLRTWHRLHPGGHPVATAARAAAGLD
jgi:beta-hydroxylase